MRDPSILTVIAVVDPGAFENLTAHLKNNVNPDEHGTPVELDFHAYPNLHFMSFCMPNAQGDMPGQLVMEATFDGPADAFIRDLVHGDLDALIRIFSHCPDFPHRASENPHLVEIYLKQHSLAAPTFFSGAPGKTVAQIKGEQRMRRKLGKILHEAPALVQAGEPRRLHDHLRREALKDADLSLMSKPPAPPWSLTNGDRMMRLLGYILILPVLSIGWGIFQYDAVFKLWEGVTPFGYVAASLSLLGAVLLLLPIMIMQDEAARAGKRVNPSASPIVFEGIAGAASLIMKTVITILCVQILFQVAQGIADRLWPGNPALLVHWTLVLGAVLISLGCFAILYGFAVYLGMVQASTGRLKRPDRTQPEADPNGVTAWIGFVKFLPVFAISWTPIATILVAVPGPTTIENAKYIWTFVVLLSGWFAAGLIAVVVLWVIALKAHDWLQRRENKAFVDPERLYDYPVENPERWAREEHGYNRRQNHYVSLTTIKGGTLRKWLVTLALTLVNFIARYKDNKGDLGGIPTIFSARWVLIDKGRRLLFMTNYAGAWDSYLNEFSELAGVIGVNMIWTNTFIAPSLKEHGNGIHFPETKLFTGKGARATLPFKAYVRQSQLETLVWYGAYPDLSVVNVSDNANIREAVFGPPNAAALDFLLKRI